MYALIFISNSETLYGDSNGNVDCRYCEYRYVLDAEWQFHVREGHTDGKILNLDKAHVTADLTYSGKKRTMLIEKESGKPFDKVLSELNYKEFVDSRSPLGEMRKFFNIKKKYRYKNIDNKNKYKYKNIDIKNKTDSSFAPVFGIIIITFIAFILYSILDLDTDPFIHGCVYDKDFGTKIDCVEIKYNEAKNPGSEDTAFDTCMNKLNRLGIKSGKSFEIIGCVSSSGPYN